MFIPNVAPSGLQQALTDNLNATAFPGSLLAPVLVRTTGPKAQP